MFRREISLERSGYTLRDLLLVVAIVALALTVGMPWILSAHVTSMQLHNRNQIKQLALALQNHLDEYKTLPPLFFSENHERKRILNPQLAAECYSWQVRILPYLEEGNLYKDIQRASDHFDLDSPAVQIPDPNNPATLISPSLVSVSVWQSNHASPQTPGACYYAATPSTRMPLLLNLTTDKHGDPDWRWPRPDGMIIPDKAARGQPVTRISDGTSKTIVLNETREQQRSNWFRPQQAFVCGFLPADSTPALSDSGGYYPYFDWNNHGTWSFNPQRGDRTAINFSPYHSSSDEPSREWGTSGTHPRGLMLVGMGDGSTHEIDPENLEPKVYFAAITARGGENVPPSCDGGK